MKLRDKIPKALGMMLVFVIWAAASVSFFSILLVDFGWPWWLAAFAAVMAAGCLLAVAAGSW